MLVKWPLTLSSVLALHDYVVIRCLLNSLCLFNYQDELTCWVTTSFLSYFLQVWLKNQVRGEFAVTRVPRVITSRQITQTASEHKQLAKGESLQHSPEQNSKEEANSLLTNQVRFYIGFVHSLGNLRICFLGQHGRL